MPDGIDLSAGFIDTPSPRRAKPSRLDDLISFAKEHNLTVGSTTGGRHNRGSKHYSGNAIDIRDSGAFSNERVNELRQAAAARGLLLRDERVRPAKQRVWGGPHVHIEAADTDLRAGFDSQEIDLSAGFEDSGQNSPPTQTSTTSPVQTARRTATKPTPATSAPTDNWRPQSMSRPFDKPFTPAGAELLRRPVSTQPKATRRSLADKLTVLPGIQQIVNLLPEEDRQNIAEGATGAVGGSIRQLANAQDLGMQLTGARALGIPNPVTPRIRSVANAVDKEVAENTELRPEPQTFAGQVRRGVGRGVGAMPIELPKLIAGGAVLKAANLPIQGALSRAEEGVPGIIKGAVGGAVYHYGSGLTGKMLGKVGNSLVWIAGPTAEQTLIHGRPLAETLGESIPMGVFAGAGGSKRQRGTRQTVPENVQEQLKQTEPVRVIENGVERVATEQDLPRIVTREVEVVPPERIDDGSRAALAETPPVATEAQPTPKATNTRQEDALGGPIRPQSVGGGQPELPQPAKFVHRDFGAVVESEAQSGVPRGRVRVVDESGTEHTILKPKGTGAGNIRTIPIKEAQLGVEPLPKQQSSPVIEQAFAGWRSRQAYIDNAGNYRIKAEGRSNGPIAPWNKEVKRTFKTVSEFHNAAQEIPTIRVEKGGSDVVTSAPEKQTPLKAADTSGTGAGSLGGQVKPPAPESLTSARKEMFKADRAELDLPELPPAERKSWQRTLDEAKQKGTENAGVLADEVLAKPRALNDVETGQIVLRAQEVKNAHNLKMKEIGAAVDPDLIQAKRAEAEALEREFDKLTTATRASGTEKGRALASQKLTINQDFDLVSVLQRAKAAKGRELKPEERAKFEGMAKQIEELSGKLSAAEVRLKESELQKQINRLARTRKRQETVKVLDEEFVLLKNEFAQIRLEVKESPVEYRQGGIGLASLDPSGKLTPVILKMARNRVKAGVTKAEDVVDHVYQAVREHVEGVTPDDIRDLLAGHNLEHDPLPGIKTRYRKQEAELTRRLEEQDYSPPPKRKPVVYDREASELKAKVEGLKRKIGAEIRGNDSKLETILAMRKAGMLTGLRTHMRNVGGTGAFQGFEEVARIPGSLADLLVSTVTKRRALGAPNPVAVAKSSYEAATKGLREAKQIMKYGATAEELAKLERPRELHSGSRLIDAYTNTVFRTLGAEDKIFRTYALKRSLEDQARLRSKELGRSKEDLAANPTSEMQAQAMLDAEVATFNNANKLAEGVEWIKQHGGPAGSIAIDLIVPFRRTPANITSRLLESTPLGLFRGGGQLLKAAINKEMPFEDQRKFSQTIGRSVTGSSLLALGYWLASKDLATGLPEDDAGDREVQKAAGRSPLAVRIGDTWHQIGAFSPMGNLIAVGAALHRERTKPLKEGEERGNLAAAALPVAGKVMLEQPFLKGASGVAEAIDNPYSRGSALIGQTLGSGVPTLVSDAGALIDNTRRERQGIVARVQERVPILRSRLPQDIDVFARPLQSRRTAAIDPTLTTNNTNEPFLRELIRLDVGVPKTNKKDDETEGQFRDRRVRQGRALADALNRTVTSPRYQQLSDEEKVEALKNAVSQTRKQINASTGTTRLRVRPSRSRRRTIQPPQ